MKLVDSKSLNIAADLLQKGEIVAFPTETVFGLGIVYDSAQAFEDLVRVKERRPDKPFTLMCSSVDEVQKYAILNDIARKIIAAFLPGELTIILKTKRRVPTWVDLGTGHIGIRVPNDEQVQALIKLVGKPLLVPSANRADQRPLISSDEVIKEFGNKIAGVVLGHSKGATPSTVIAAYDRIIMLREGNLRFNEIMKVVGGD
ncbi:MAG: L-threonylcarbamoyladenylate synthase [Bacilli bacterium]|jgi:L-threonylcarbamoyladenylate synthase